jgi:IS30 family transposase
MDLIVRLPETTNKSSYILVIKCRMSQFLIAKPLRTKKAKDVAEAVYKNLYCQHGTVRRVTTDRGGEFVNNIHQAIKQLLAQRGTSTTPYNSPSNGQAENAVKSIKDMLSAYAYRNQTN